MSEYVDRLEKVFEDPMAALRRSFGIPDPVPGARGNRSGQGGTKGRTVRRSTPNQPIEAGDTTGYGKAVRGGFQISPITAQFHKASRESDAYVADQLSDASKPYYKLFGGGSGGSETRTNENDIDQKGKALSGSQLLKVLPNMDANRFLTGNSLETQASPPVPFTEANPDIPSSSTKPTNTPQVDFNKGVPFTLANDNPISSRSMTDDGRYIPLFQNNQAKTEEPTAEAPKPSRQRGSARQQEFAARPGNQSVGGDEPSTADLVSPMYANPARNAARRAFLDAPRGSGPMGTVGAAREAVGVNKAGTIAQIDGQMYSITPDQAFALTQGAGGTREGLDAIRNAATLIEDPNTTFPEANPDVPTIAAESTVKPVLTDEQIVPITTPDDELTGLANKPSTAALNFKNQFIAGMK